MNTADEKISPVDVKERKALGIKAGDTVRVWQKIEEKGKTRLQAFEGLVLATKHGTEPGATFTVRKVSLGVGVEKVFPLYSPNIDKIEIIKRARVRRSKLYFVRDKVARELRRIFRKTTEVYLATKGAAELEEERKRAEEELKKQEEEAAKRAEEEAKNESESQDENTNEGESAEELSESGDADQKDTKSDNEENAEAGDKDESGSKEKDEKPSEETPEESDKVEQKSSEDKSEDG